MPERTTIKITETALDQLTNDKIIVYMPYQDTYRLFNENINDHNTNWELSTDKTLNFELPEHFAKFVNENDPFLKEELAKIMRLIVALLECDCDLATIKARLTAEV